MKAWIIFDIIGTNIQRITLSESEVRKSEELGYKTEPIYTLADLQAAREEERERCVEEVHRWRMPESRAKFNVGWNAAIDMFIDAIRALGDKEEGKS